MPRKRRQTAVEEEDEENVQYQNDQDSDEDVDADGDGDQSMRNGEDSNDAQLIKKLVRYALACEYSRTPIRREGIKEKVLGTHGRAFKRVFDGAQKQLIAAFGMRMVAIPARDKATLTAEQRRKAAKSQSQTQSSNSYLLVSHLPDRYRNASIIAPSKIQSEEAEAAYVGLYTTLIAIITLSGGELSDPRLRRFLTRLNASESMPSAYGGASGVEKTELVLQRMIKQGYLIKVLESKVMGEEESTTWYVGARGKLEVDNEAIAAMARNLYGGSSDELEKQLQASLKIKELKPDPRQDLVQTGEDGGEREETAEAAEAEYGDPASSSRRQQSSRKGKGRIQEEEEENDEDEDEDEEDDDEMEE